jgi:murein DD-endopeptidase MepM/ murein hydrolase activator NlpD
MIGDFFLAGTVVYLDHGGGLTSAYFHLSAVTVAVGDTVARGQRIGSVGATGRVTGPHLHWVVRYGTASVDPLDALELQVPPSGDVVPLCR